MRKPANRPPRYLGGYFTSVLLALTALCLGCHTAPVLPPTDLSAPGWRVLQGQAVWRPEKNRPELAGELLMATNTTGDSFVQFLKTPFPMATAQVVSNRWRIEFGSNKFVWGGNGVPPARFVWFQLPRALAGANPSGPWQFTRTAADSWRFENPRTGETLEGGFYP